MVVSSAVTLTLKVVSPTDSDTWWPASTLSASVSVASLASRYATVALLSFTVGATVISSTALATSAV